MEALRRQYRCYALDFWGFGDSGKSRNSYEITDFVDLVDQFMDRLGIEAAPVVGHSMGGTVAASLALLKPHRTSKVIMVGSPISGDSLNIFLKLASVPFIANLVWQMPTTLSYGIKAFSPYIVKDSDRWYKMITRDLSSTTLEAFFSSINSLRRTDLRSDLSSIHSPIMGIYGVGDNVVQPSHAKIITQRASLSKVVIIDDCKHFPMLDQPQYFNQHLSDFLAYDFSTNGY